MYNNAKKAFTDALKIRVKGGNGGAGLPRFGGIGGKGGDVYIRASQNVKTLHSLLRRNPSKYFVARDGEVSRRTYLLGRAGHDFIIKVPVGVTVEDTEKQILGDLDKNGEQVLVAYGGRGGDKQTDHHAFHGQERTVRLNFKMISDVAFVGFPNAGKSTLLRAVSNAIPKVASYPFTTLRPHLGVVKYPDLRTITMTDLPGLVEGAHKNIGLGHDFLKHIERARLLVFVIDVNNVDLGLNYPRRSPFEALCILNKEIELYDDTILDKPAILLLSKMDTVDKNTRREHLGRLELELDRLREDPTSCKLNDDAIRPTRLLSFEHVLPITCLKHNRTIDNFKTKAREVIDKYADLAKLERDKFQTFEEVMHKETNRLIQS